MTSNIDALNTLAKLFEKHVAEAERFDDESGALMLVGDDDELVDEATRITLQYEDEMARSPDNIDVKWALAGHLYNVGNMYYQALISEYLPVNNGDQGELEGLACLNAQRACKFLSRSHNLVPSGASALVLGEVFRTSRFYATAIHWFSQATRLCDASHSSTTRTEIEAEIQELESEGKTTDPNLDPRWMFPTRTTPGLLLQGQPVVGRIGASATHEPVEIVKPPVAQSPSPRAGSSSSASGDLPSSTKGCMVVPSALLAALAVTAALVCR